MITFVATDKVICMRRVFYGLIMCSLLGSGWVHAAHTHAALGSDHSHHLVASGGSIDADAPSDDGHSHSSGGEGACAEICDVCAAFVVAGVPRTAVASNSAIAPESVQGWPNSLVLLDPLLLRRDRPPR